MNPSPNAMQMPRVGSVTNESGGTVAFTYGQSHPPTNNSSDYCYKLGTNNQRRRCDMYVAWDSFSGSGGWVWWHKWKVTQTVEDAGSGQGGSDPITLTYGYDAPEFAHSGKTGLGAHNSGQCKYGYGCNVWNDFRGHRKVTVTDATGARVEHFFYTGMENDRAEPLGNTGWLKDSPSSPEYQLATVTDPTGASHRNRYELAGRPLGTATYSGLGQLLSRTVTTYGVPAAQANSSTYLFTQYPLSYQLNYQVDKSWVNYSPGNATTIFSQVNTYFDSKGMINRVTDLGDMSTGTDDRTTFTYYTQNTGHVWIVNTPSLVATRAGASGTFSWQGMLAATAYEYDGGAYGAAPTFGWPTRVKEQIETNSSQDPVWEWTDYTYMPRGAVMTESRRGRNGTETPQVTDYGFDWTHGHIVSTDGPLGAQDDYSYVVDPAHGQPTTVTDPNGANTYLTYDSQARLTSARPPGYSKPTVKYTYFQTRAGVDSVKTETLREIGAGTDEYVSSWDFYDGLGRHVQSHAKHWNPSYGGFNLRSATRYDNTGRVAAQLNPKYRSGTAGTYATVNWSNPGAAHQRYEYPLTFSGNPVIDVGCNGGGNTIVRFYGADNTQWDATHHTQCGLIARSWDFDDHRSTVITNARGLTVQTYDRAGQLTTFNYDRLDRLASVTDPVGNTTTYTYANNNRQPTQLNDPDLGTITYTYDGFGRLDTQTDARGVTVDVTWDAANRPTVIKQGINLVSRWTYDPAGHAGRVATEEHWNRQLDGTHAGFVKRSYGYNSRHQVASTTWQIPNLPGTTQTVDYTYRDSGSPDTITYPNGVSVDYGYNRLEQPDSVTSSAGTISPWVNYDAAGRPVEIRRGSAGSNWSKTTRTYDPNTQRLTSLVTINNASTNVQDYTYTYTADGLIGSIKDTSVVAGQTVNQTSCFVYDLMHQLKRAYTRTDHTCTPTGTTDNNGVDPYTVTYTHSPVGAITSANGEGTVNGNYSYPMSGSPQPHAPTQAGNRTYTYDQAGNRTTQTTSGNTLTYAYDVQNRLLSINGTGQGAGSGFLYDTQGNRARRIAPGQPQTYYLDGGRYETTTPGNATTTIHVTIAGQTIAAIVDGVIWTTAGDHLGSASYSADPTGTTHPTPTLPTLRRDPRLKWTHATHRPRVHRPTQRPHRPLPLQRPLLRPHPPPIHPTRHHHPQPPKQPRLEPLHLRQKQPTHLDRPDRTHLRQPRLVVLTLNLRLLDLNPSLAKGRIQRQHYLPQLSFLRAGIHIKDFTARRR